MASGKLLVPVPPIMNIREGCALGGEWVMVKGNESRVTLLKYKLLSHFLAGMILGKWLQV